jgi:hypothetical protein
MKDFKKDQTETMDRLLRKHLGASSESSRQQCDGFDPDRASAYFEKTLGPAEEQVYEQHLSGCHACRKHYTEFFQFAAESIETPIKKVEVAEKSWFSLEALRAWIFGPQLRWVVPAVLVLIVASTVWVVMDQQPSTSLPAGKGGEQVAQKTDEVQPSSSPSAPEEKPEVKAPVLDNKKVEQPSPGPKPGAKELQSEPASLGKAAPVVVSSSPAGERDGASEDLLQKQRARSNNVTIDGVDESSGRSSAAPAPSLQSAAKDSDKVSDNAISGVIVDNRGRSVSGAQVILRETSTGFQQYANADQFGKFSFNSLPKGNYLVEAQTESQAKSQLVSVENKDVNNVRLQLDQPAEVAINDSLKEKSGRAELRRAQPQPLRQPEAKADKKEENKPAAEPPPPPMPPKSVPASGAGAIANKDVKPTDLAKGDSSDTQARRDARSVYDDKAQTARGPAKSISREKDSSKKRGGTTGLAVSSEVAEQESTTSKMVGGKTFLFVNNIWTDSEYLPKAEKSKLKNEKKDLKVVKLDFASEAYAKALKETPALKQYFNIGEQVIVVYKNTVYIITKR